MARTTKYSRGTDSYLAPELLNERAVVTSAVDIWGLGCLLYELATSKRAFSGYGEIREFATSRRGLKIPVLPFEKFCGIYVADMIHELLTPDPSKRPAIEDARAKFPNRQFQWDGPVGLNSYDWITAQDKALIHNKVLRNGFLEVCIPQSIFDDRY
jgi:serine/threonine protein kinase